MCITTTALPAVSRLRCEQEVYRVQEGSRPSVDVCAVEITGRVEDDVQFRTVDGTATGTHVMHLYCMHISVLCLLHPAEFLYCTCL